MKRTLEELGELRADPTPDAVHDLRVALRRCRSVASAIEEIDPHSDWEEMRDCARKLFRSLGELRDAQVMEDWVNEIEPGEDALKRALLDSLKKTEESAQAKALHQAAKFDQKRWSDLAKALRSRLRRVPADGDAACCLAVERLQEAWELHRRALRTDKPGPWHALRIGVKRFRYTLESLVPAVHEKWSDSLKRVQDVLGDVHDLDVLLAMVQETKAHAPADTVTHWESRIAHVRHEKLQTYRQLALGNAGTWQNWMSAFPKSGWPRYAAARIAATRSAMDRKPGRSLALSRLARKLWSQLRACGAGPVFANAGEERVLAAAVRLSGIRPRTNKKPRVKAARTFLLRSPVPPAWTFAEWERAAWAIRFQRGAEPGSEKRRFARLAAEQQAGIILLAGILRLAHAARKCRITPAALKLESLPQGLLLHLSGVQETPERAAQFTEAKRLLERCLAKTILVRPLATEGAAQPETPHPHAPAIPR